MDIPEPRVCISVLNWNSYQHTIHCLESLQTLDHNNYTIVVVDNASADDSVAHIKAAFPDVDIIQSESNHGYAGGHELALQHALDDGETELFWILNNDTVVSPDALRAFIAAYERYGVALYGGVVLEGEDHLLKMYLFEYRRNRLFLKYHDLDGIPYASYFQTPEPREVNNLHGSTLLIPLTVVRQYGFMDTSYFMYAEEYDYCLRLAKHGVKSILVPASTVIHTGGASGTKRSALGGMMQYYRIRNRLIFYRRHVSWLYYVYKLADTLLVMLKRAINPPANLPERWFMYTALGIRDSLIGRMGKTFAPEDWLD